MLKSYFNTLTLLFALFFSQALFGLSSKSYEFTKNELQETTTHINQEQDKWVVQSFSRTASSLPRRVTYDVLDNYFEALTLYHKSTSLQQDKDSAVLFANLPLVSTEVKNRKIWDVENSWDENWEERFSQWVSQEIDLEFFRRYGLVVDCADVGLSLRWIFSFIHKLPVANSLTSNGQLITHETFKRSYLGLKRSQIWYENEVFLAAIKYLNESANTKSLINDLYPAAISKDYIHAGTIYMTRGHVRVVKSVTDDGSNYPLEFTYGTVPASLNVYREYFFLGVNQPDRSYGGFLNFRWPIYNTETARWALTEEQSMNGYSLEQYTPKFQKNFYQKTFESLGLTIKPKSIIKSITSNMKELLEVRKNIVEDGYDQCLNSDCHEESDLYDEWSTPSRDKRVDALFKSLESFSLNYKLESLRLKQLKLKKVNILNQDVSLLQLSQYFRHKLVSGDPRDPIAARWGLDHAYFSKTKRIKLARLLEKAHILSYCKEDACESERVIREIIVNESKLSEFNKQLEEYIYICHYSEKSNCSLENDLELLSLILNPYQSVDQVLEETSHKRFSIVPQFERSLEQAESNLLILDHRRVFDINQSGFVFDSDQTHSLYFLAKEKVWIELTKNHSLNIYDFSFNLVKSEKLGSNFNYKKLRLITDDHFYLGLCSQDQGCSYNLYSFKLGELKLEKAYSSGITLRYQETDSLLNDSEGVCFKDNLRKKDDCYFQVNRQTRRVSIESSDSIPLLFDLNILSRKNAQLRVTDALKLSSWDTQIQGRISSVFNVFENTIFISTTEKEDNCHLLDFKNKKISTTSCSSFVKPYISSRSKTIYVSDLDGSWKMNSGFSSWSKLDGKEPLGFSEEGKLIFGNSLSSISFTQLTCLAHYRTGYYPCHGKNAKFKAVKNGKKYIIRNRDLNFKRNLNWQPSYYRSQKIRLFKTNELMKFSEFHYLMKSN